MRLRNFERLAAALTHGRQVYVPGAGPCDEVLPCRRSDSFERAAGVAQHVDLVMSILAGRVTTRVREDLGHGRSLAGGHLRPPPEIAAQTSSSSRFNALRWAPDSRGQLQVDLPPEGQPSSSKSSCH